MTTQFPISEVIDISVSNTPTGINEYNTGNLALFSDDVPADSFGSSGYKIYYDAVTVATDFGASSKTASMAAAIFSQQPNILLPDGSLIVIQLETAIETLALSAVAASGTFVLNFGGHATAAINWNDTASEIQTKLQAVSGLSQVAVTGSIASQSLVVALGGIYGESPAVFTITSNTLEDSGSDPITITPTITTEGQSVNDALVEWIPTLQFFGSMVNEVLSVISQSDLLAAAATIQAQTMLFYIVSTDAADVAPGGSIDLLRSGSFTQTRGLLYEDATSLGVNALDFAAAYASLLQSVDFDGSDTAITMHLKQLATINPDPNIDSDDLAAAQMAGADCYISIQGDSGCFISGANLFSDDIQGRLWLAGALGVAGFNYLAQSNTKIPQTEQGMTGLKGAYRGVLEQAVVNGFSAPGSWTSSTTFGNQIDLVTCVAQRGYYIYSAPVASQLQADRVARKAPLVQIALKEAGAIQSSSVVVYINQ
jgi:hypothetical protein